MNEKDPLSLAGTTVHIIGPHSMQNQLLAAFLTEKTGATCVTGKSPVKYPTNGGNGALILWDCQNKPSNALLGEIQHHAPGDDRLMMLFNLNRDANIEREAVNLGIRGFIYENEKFDQLPRAVVAVSKGELWLSRVFMSKWILSTKRNGQSSKVDSGLTPKEVEILSHLAAGASNKEIADRFYISANAAKTHVYNIFKKIKVTNRLQAALWAGKNLLKTGDTKGLEHPSRNRE